MMGEIVNLRNQIFDGKLEIEKRNFKAVSMVYS